MKITILDRSTVTNGDISLEPIERLGDTKSYDILPHEKLAQAIADSECVICNKAQITKDVMEKCPKLKFVGLFATGYNNVDIKYAAEHGITVCNVPGYSTDSVAQLTFALILQLTTHLSEYTSSVAAGDWVSSKSFTYFPYAISELAGKTLGIYGFGTIGKAVAKIADAFNMKVIVYKRNNDGCDGYEYVTPEQLFSRSDFVTLHCPLNDDSKELICEKTLSLMKPTAYLINTARGGCVNEKELADALNGGRIAGAGIDVLTVEPMLSENPLLSAKNCYITPHVAWASYEARERLIYKVAENIAAYQKGMPINKVN